MNDQGPISLRPEHPQRRALSQLVTEFGLDLHGSADGVEISGVSLSSGAVEPGDLYIGMPGVRVHGAAYAEQAKERGAVAVLTDDADESSRPTAGLPIIVEPEPRAALGAPRRLGLPHRRGATDAVRRDRHQRQDERGLPPERHARATRDRRRASARPLSGASATSRSRAPSPRRRPPSCTRCSRACARPRCARSSSRSPPRR